MTPGRTKAYSRRFKKQRSEARTQGGIDRALYRADPDNPKLATLLPGAGGRCREDGGFRCNEGAKELTGELNEVIARSKSDELKTDAAYWKAWIAGDPFTAAPPRKTTPRRQRPSTSSSPSPPRTSAEPTSSTPQPFPR